jgi:hypothetical protein
MPPRRPEPQGIRVRAAARPHGGCTAIAALPATRYLGDAAGSRSIWLAGICAFFVSIAAVEARSLEGVKRMFPNLANEW